MRPRKLCSVLDIARGVDPEMSVLRERLGIAREP